MVGSGMVGSKLVESWENRVDAETNFRFGIFS